MLPDINKELQALRETDRFRSTKQIESAQETRIRIDDRDLILFCSNNYLGLANHPTLKGAAVEAIHRYGTSSVASALISGYMAPHAELETCMAKFLTTEASVVFPTGYTANLGVMTALLGPDDIIFSDQLNHRSIIDGCRLSRAKVEIYSHGDTDHLHSKLQNAKNYRRRLIVTDGVFSMDGDIAPLPELVSLAQEFQTILMVDDAHGTGVLGANGRGTFEHFGLSSDAIDIHMTSGSKALGASGGFISGRSDLIDLIRNRSASYIYTTAMPPDACASTTASLDLISNTPAIRQNLWHNIETIREGLQKLGFDVGNTQTQIIPIIIG
ncbi:MAG: 8-amino-7-oxononanoate synthase, partial [Candidatus Latescibacteria bacterium]|nr:8-amino-7-oxononanoate synthase [Candidatus Latescibacterota bacterium]